MVSCSSSWTDSSEDEAREPQLLHELKNHLAVIVGFSELVLANQLARDVHEDVTEIHKAAQAAAVLLPRLVAQLERRDEAATSVDTPKEPPDQKLTRASN